MPVWANGPGLAITLTIFLFSLAGIPPFAGWFAKFVMFRAVLDATLAVGGHPRCDRRARLGDRVLLLRRAWPARCGSTTRRPRPRSSSRPIPAALTVAIGLCVTVTVVVGVYPQIVARIGELAFPI